MFDPALRPLCQAQARRYVLWRGWTVLALADERHQGARQAKLVATPMLPVPLYRGDCRPWAEQQNGESDAEIRKGRRTVHLIDEHLSNERVHVDQRISVPSDSEPVRVLVQMPSRGFSERPFGTPSVDGRFADLLQPLGEVEKLPERI